MCGVRATSIVCGDAYRAPMSDEQRIAAERLDDLPFGEWQAGVEDAAERLSGHVRHAARNAFVHLRKAWRLHGVDDEMSGFRAITAEEEAATALILALKQRGYPGSSKLNAWNHVHKSAFWPLLAAINDLLFQSGFPAPQVHLSRTMPPRVTLHINLTAMAGGTGNPVWGNPDEPLNFSLRSGAAEAAAIHLFEAELENLASIRGAKSVLKHIEAEANLRNLLLYARSEGLPHATFEDAALLEKARRVSVLVTLAIMVMQTTQHQLFVVQCLEALLRAIGKIEEELIDYEAAVAPANLPLLAINRLDGGPAIISITRKLGVVGRFTWPPSRSAYEMTRAPGVTFREALDEPRT